MNLTHALEATPPSLLSIANASANANANRSIANPKQDAPGAGPDEARPAGRLEAAMERLAGGDDRAFVEVYRGTAPRVYALFMRLGSGAPAADDLLQETYLRVYRARSGYRRGAKVLPWIYAIARRLMIDRAHERRRAQELHRVYGLTVAMAGGPPRADDEIAARRMERAIDQILDQIPPAQARAFRMVKEDGLSLAEAAAELGDTNLALRLRTHRACKAIRAALSEHL